MAEQKYTLRIAGDHLNSFFAYLCMGTLYAIQKGMVPPTVGIWTLGMPKVHTVLDNNAQFSKNILEVIQTMDELDALHRLSLDHFKEEIDRLITKLQKELQNPENQQWDFEWVTDDTGVPPTPPPVGTAES